MDSTEEESMNEYAKCLSNFETKFHQDVYTWISSKLSKTEPLDLLNISGDDCIFTSLLAKRLTNLTIVHASPTSAGTCPIDKKIKVAQIQISSAETLPDQLSKVGPFDVILIKDAIYQAIDHLETFFLELKKRLKTETSKIFVLQHPKSPPLPLPDPAMDTWRKSTPSREQIIAPCIEVKLSHDSFTASCPIRIETREWGNILKGRFIPAVKDSVKCTDKEINEFVRSRSAFLQFEEKYLIILMAALPDAPQANDAAAETPK